MQQTGCLVLCIAALLAGLGNCQCGISECAEYNVFYPKYLRPGMDISASVTLPKVSENVTLECFFYSSDYALNFSKSLIFEGNTTALSVLGKIPWEYTNKKISYTLNITAYNLTSGEILLNISTTDFQFNYTGLSMLIQTDKPVYKPGQTIKFRGMILDPEFFPIFGNVTYEVKDPKNNTILFKKNVQLSQGVVTDELSLSKFAETGKWNITIKYLNFNKTITIPVTNIIAPKYDVIIKTPSYLCPRTQPGFSISLKATYPTGEKVKGSAKILIALKSPTGQITKYSQITKKFLFFDGAQEVYIGSEELIQVLNWNGISNPVFVVVGIVKEALTGFKYNATSFINVTETNIKVKLINKPQVIKPGLPILFHALVTEQDGKPLQEEVMMANNVLVKVIYREEGGSVYERLFTYPIPLDGLVTLNFTTERDYLSVPDIQIFTTMKSTQIIQLVYLPPTSNFQTLSVQRAFSPSNSFIQLTTTQPEFYPGKLAQFNITTSTVVDHIKFLIMADDQIIQTGNTTKSSIWDKLHQFNFTITNKMIPYVKIIAYYMTDIEENVMDIIEVPVKLDFFNKVKMSVDSEKLVPGENISITVNASSYSYIGIQAVEKKFELNEDDSDIPSSQWKWMFPTSSSASYSDKLIKNSKIGMLTSGYNITEEVGSTSSGLKNEKEEKLLMKFKWMKFLEKYPQSWFWEQKMAGSNGTVTFNTTLPNKASSLKLFSFAISYRYGLGIATPLEVEASEKLFMSLNLPLKAAIGETTIAKLVLLNKFDRPLSVDLNLMIDEAQGLELIQPFSPFNTGSIRTVIIPAGEAVNQLFPIRYRQFGEKSIAVRATVARYGINNFEKTVERKIYVEPEGEKKCKTQSVLVERKFSSSRFTVEKLNLRVPEDIVSGTGKLNITIYGNVLGKLLNQTYLDYEIPKGSGELNLPTFAAAVFPSLFLKKTDQSYPEIKDKFLKNVIKSYMSELRYKLDEKVSNDWWDSYNSFGEKEFFGNNVLTSLVYKCFAFAYELNNELIDSVLLNRTFSYLIGQPLLWEKLSVNMPKEEKLLQIQQIALIAIVMKETTLHAENETLQRTIIEVKKTLEDQLDFLKINEEPYILSLVTYALHLTYSEKAEEAFKMLIDLAIFKDGKQFWNQEVNKKKPCRGKRLESASIKDVEIASYALLTYILRDEFYSAIPVLKWIVAQQNHLGLFSSAMDSVVAIQALAKSAEILAAQPKNLSISFQKDSIVPYSFNLSEKPLWINKTNNFFNYSTTITQVNREIWLNASGIGSVIAEISTCYNTPKVSSQSKDFNCTYDITPFNFDHSVHLNFCCTPNMEEHTKQVLYRINFLNGFKLNESSLFENNPVSKNIEINQDNIIFYYDRLTTKANVCASVYQTKQDMVAAIQPANITVWEYQTPGRKMKTSYNVTDWNNVSVCEVCGSECVGCEETQFYLLDQWTPCVEFCQFENQRQIPTCFDPNRNTTVDLSLCDYVDPNTRTCHKQNFSCPDFYEGMWFEALALTEPSNCQLKGRSGTASVLDIPATYLDGETSYLECAIEEKVLESGFTYSFLMKFNEQPFIDTQLLYLGSNPNEQPVVSFKYRSRGDLIFEVNYKYSSQRLIVETNVNEIFPSNLWRMVTLTWKSDSEPRVYLDGNLFENTFLEVTDTFTKALPTENLTLYLGAAPPHTAGAPGFDVLDGAVSGLIAWHKNLIREEVLEVYSFFLPLLENQREEEPVLSPRHFSFFAPKSVRSCFTESSTLSGFNIRTLETCQEEKLENLFGFTPFRLR